MAVDDAAGAIAPPTAAVPEEGAAELLAALRDARDGDFSVRLAHRARDLGGLAVAFDERVERNERLTGELVRVARELGHEGRMTERARLSGADGDWTRGAWATAVDSLNGLIDDLVRPTTEIARVIVAVADGDLSQKMALTIGGQPLKGEFLRIGRTVNTMVDQLSSFAAEVTGVAREVGTEGKLGGQAEVPGAAGTWKDLTESVNSMASNLTGQVRNIAQVTTAVANGDLSQKITVEAKGEVAALADTINEMVEQLRSFAAEVTRVAREVGTEGKLGGQAEVPGAAGTWRRLTENVNQLAGNLTTQVRAIAEVSTAVAQGDLTRSISVEAQGEVAELKDNINRMIANLRDTTARNEEQNWLKTNLARISGLMQGQRDLTTVTRLIMSELTPTVSAQHGALFLAEGGVDGAPLELRLVAGYGYTGRAGVADRFALGQSLVGQAALERRTIRLDDVPGDYIRISSGLGDAAAASILIMPILFEGRVLGVIELAWLRAPSEIHRSFVEQLVETLGVVLNTITANMRTEALLQQSQSLNAELEQQAQLLEQRNLDIEGKNREIDQARMGLEEKAGQLALSSRYKSEFLANMSHELRTPLNSLLILSKLLLDNEAGNLTAKQRDFARTIHAAGADLLELINDILDLSKIEAGKMDLLPEALALSDVCDYVRRTFDPVAADKGLALDVVLDEDVPAAIVTDEQRLQQILRNLLSNAFKFTAEGGVTLRISRAPGERLKFSVVDSGIGIAADKLAVIFEAFQQADGTTSRTYGGTGLGLSISRELARALRGELSVTSTPGRGSAFTLTLRPDGVRDLPTGSERPQAQATHLDGLVPARAPEALLRRPPDAALEPRLSGRVLLVDDDVRNLFALASLLEDRGVEVVFSETGAEALEILATDPGIDLVLMDIMMPQMDGHETIRVVRRMPGLGTLPIIALTAKAMQGDREKSIAAGASDYVTKPVDPDKLVALVGGWLDAGASATRPAA